MNNEIRIEDVLRDEGMYVCTVSGISMYPMLRNRRDTVLIRPKPDSLKKYDVPLYRRGDNYVLHRIIKVLPNGKFHIRGDNCIETEKNIPEDCIIGILDKFWRDDKEISVKSFGYKMYARFCVALYPAVFIFKKARGRIRRLFYKP